MSPGMFETLNKGGGGGQLASSEVFSRPLARSLLYGLLFGFSPGSPGCFGKIERGFFLSHALRLFHWPFAGCQNTLHLEAAGGG